MVGYWALRSSDDGVTKQVRAMQGQLDEMRAEQRAWVYADLKPLGPVTYDQHGMLIPVGFIIHNTGKLPAKDVVPVVAAHVENGTALNNWIETQRATCTDRKPGSSDIFGEMLFPGVVDSNTARELAISWNEMAGAGNSGMVVVDIGGCVEYFSTGDPKMHHTYFAYKLADVRTTGPDHAAFISLKNSTVPLEAITLLKTQILGLDAD
jgi:hypothetical protein